MIERSPKLVSYWCLCGLGIFPLGFPGGLLAWTPDLLNASDDVKSATSNVTDSDAMFEVHAASIPVRAGSGEGDVVWTCDWRGRSVRCFACEAPSAVSFRYVRDLTESTLQQDPMNREQE